MTKVRRTQSSRRDFLRGVRKYIVEHDNPTDPLATAAASFDHLSRLTF